ncbi:putative DNA polymerase zeta catalytic subunit [Paratrimastix pyriformis]|uniref:DNA polymerase n=1 Tax=Paratrimastix pyriformis TaxID=342808 RepID=A0ABQ8UKC5_9EUKA|nr:putative DNA polymerase zeta catalytic subunit [Paratrimastix pyriformis]
MGRVVVPMWRFARRQFRLASNSIQAAAWEIMGIRLPAFSCAHVAAWYRAPAQRWRALQAHMSHCAVVLRMAALLELVTQVSELARVNGCLFEAILVRGSQFRVEALLGRLTKPRNFVMPSPSRHQVFGQSAPQCVPLVMEPRSGMHGPVAVLDFQSLYPSIMIAYNYCYSTCVGCPPPAGRVAKRLRRLGVTALDVGELDPDALRPHIHVAPNGVGFLKRSARVGVVPRMLAELLETRVMTKAAGRLARDKAEERVLAARQLAFKLICNVTYGYTGAGYSGRMPCVELADAVVQTARQTLEMAVRTAESHAGYRVLYGDTDSLFVAMPPGCSVAEAFRRGAELADEVTRGNPAPVRLMMEKHQQRRPAMGGLWRRMWAGRAGQVYDPVILVTKKRYCGLRYSDPAGGPVFESKGLETIRRDQCPLTQRILTAAITRVLETRRVDAAREPLLRALAEVGGHRVPLHEFVFRREVRQGYRTRTLPPAATVAAQNPAIHTSHGERVAYVVVARDPRRGWWTWSFRRATPSSRDRLTIRLSGALGCVSWHGRSTDLRIHVSYYITRQILPPEPRPVAPRGSWPATRYRCRCPLVAPGRAGSWGTPPGWPLAAAAALASRPPCTATPSGRPAWPAAARRLWRGAAPCRGRPQLAGGPRAGAAPLLPMPLCRQCARSPTLGVLAILRQVAKCEAAAHRARQRCLRCMAGLADRGSGREGLEGRQGSPMGGDLPCACPPGSPCTCLGVGCLSDDCPFFYWGHRAGADLLAARWNWARSGLLDLGPPSPAPAPAPSHNPATT